LERSPPSGSMISVVSPTVCLVRRHIDEPCRRLLVAKPLS
jgi:hypothetical protein